MGGVTVLNYKVSKSVIFNSAPLEFGKIISNLDTQLLLFLTVLAAISFGLSYGDGNQSTYIPPGIRLIDPQFLAGDWWATNISHYHIAFSGLVAVLYSFGIIEWGLAAINTLCILCAFWAMYQFGKAIGFHYLPAVFLLLISQVVMSSGLFGVAVTYLFDSYFQASTLATMGTLLALNFFVQKRFMLTGIFLALAGTFHSNFLVLNIVLFGLAYVFTQGRAFCRPDSQ